MGKHSYLLQKACGGCTECCRGPLPVPELDISQGNPCRHLCETGCGDYENRLEVCRIFSCVWKTNFVRDDLRPDKARAICKWTEDGSLLLVPIDAKVPMMTIERWKDFAKKTGQVLKLYSHDTGLEKTLVTKRRAA